MSAVWFGLALRLNVIQTAREKHGVRFGLVDF